MLSLISLTLATAPVPLVSQEESLSTFVFEIRDGAGQPMPARLTFLKGDGEDPGSIFDIVDGDPNHLAVRRNVVYSADGSGTIQIPSGEWRIIASRGLEYAVAQCNVSLSKGTRIKWTTSLQRIVDTTGWVGGDFHLHTLTHSGHGDSNMPERMISIAGEGVEFAVATDHNVNIDYTETMKATNTDSWFTAVTGNEISANYGHFNAYPLDPDAKVIDWHAPAPALFAETRANVNAWGIVPVMQVNHPRWGDIDYFGALGLDPWIAESTHPEWTWDFDAVEIMNENAGWGWYDAEIDDEAVDSCSHSVMRDWINMVNAGRQIAPMGNSDSHAVETNFAGIPRTYVHVDDTDAANIDPVEVANAVRRGAVLATTGPFITVNANGGGPGDRIDAEDGQLDITIKVQAAPWVPVDRVKVLANGDEVFSFNLLEDGYKPPMSIGPLSLVAAEDAWITVIAESDRSMAPVVRDRRRPIRPLAVTGPIRVDADGDGHWTPPLASAQMRVADADGQWDTLADEWERQGPFGRSMLVQAAARNPELADDAITAALDDNDRLVVATGILAAEAQAVNQHAESIREIIVDPLADQALAYTAWAAGDRIAPDPEGFHTYVERFGMEAARRHRKEHPFRLPGSHLRDWEVSGFFDAPSMDALDLRQSPEPGIVHITPPLQKNGEPLSWRSVTTPTSGLLDLVDGSDEANHAIVYARTIVHSPKAQRVAFTVGSDDGCKIWINDQLVWVDAAYQGATPDAKTFEANLQQGDNTVLVKLLNGTGGFGLYLRPLSDTVKSAVKSHTD
ncbi:MAG: CehA/McbA family metallohydrolase [Phycisphaerales bacterium]|nr:CehA/McbA family metallohydrolase [Phycisphaerales bacterium]